jgi:transcriptional regulator with XRE-family HTH domain
LARATAHSPFPARVRIFIDLFFRWAESSAPIWQHTFGFMENKMAGINLGPLVPGWNRFPENMALVGVVRRRRLRLGLSLNQLANLTQDHAGHPQVSRQMLGFFEADTHPLGLHVLGLVARVLGTTSAQLLSEAQRWIARLPGCCHACKYACLARGELPWLDTARQCTRPPKAPYAPPAILPVRR